MFFKLTLLIFISTYLYAADQIDYGDGLEGPCSFSGIITARVYNCTTVTTSAPITVSGNDLLDIRATESVTISHDMILSGEDGQNGQQDLFPSVGGSAIALGSDGGGCLNSIFCDPQNGLGTGGGNSGEKGNGIIGITEAGGGGGANGLSNLIPPTDGSDGIVNDGVATEGGGGVAGNSDFLNPLTLNDLIIGGHGGGSGGSATNSVNFASGGAGGAGGGAIKISAKGNVSIDANIEANGGNGGNGIVVSGEVAGSGGGGGGSGGVIFIQTEGQITITGALYALGGTGGLGAPNGNGGDGGSGLIRLDDRDGSVNVGASSPTPTILQSFFEEAPEVPNDDSSEDDKLVANSTFSCGSINQNPKHNSEHTLSFLLGVFLVLLKLPPLHGGK